MGRFFVFFLILAGTNVFALDVASVKDISGENQILSVSRPAGSSFADSIVRIEAQQEAIQNFKMKCDVDFYSEKNGTPEKVALSGEVIGYQEGWFKASICYGIIDVIDFGLSSVKNVVLKMSRDSISYVGTLEEAKNGAKMARILSTDVSGIKMLFPEMWDEKANCRFFRVENGRKVVYVCFRENNFIQPIKKICFSVEKNREVITKIIRYENKEVFSIVEYSDYRDFPVEGSTVFIPSNVVLNINAKTKLVFAVKSLEINRTNKPSETRVWAPEAHQIRKFSQMTE